MTTMTTETLLVDPTWWEKVTWRGRLDVKPVHLTSGEWLGDSLRCLLSIGGSRSAEGQRSGVSG